MRHNGVVPNKNFVAPDVTAMVEDLGRLVNIESPSMDIPALTASARELAAMMQQRLGAPPMIVDSAVGPHVHWSGGGNPKVLIVGHHDTVFAKGALAERPFTVVADRATGPGIFDMKAGIIQAIYGVAALADKSGVEILITSDEEVGSHHSRDFIVERAQACGAVLVLEPSADGGALKTARKGTGTFELHVHGRASHAGLEPEKGVNALIEAAQQILEIAQFGDGELGTTVTPTVAVIGSVDNVVPAHAKISIDVRVVEAQERQRVETAMNSLIVNNPQARLEMKGGFNRPPMAPTASTWLFPMAVEVANELGLPAVHGVAVGGGSDGNFTAAAGVATLDGLGAVGGGAHADHEWVDVAQMPQRALLIAGLVQRLQNRSEH